MKRVGQVAPPTPKRQNARAPGGTLPAVAKADDKNAQKDLKFMEATFKVVGYQPRSEENQQSLSKKKGENDQDSVFQPNRRNSLAPGKLALVSFIEKNYQVPENFETNTAFGPHSGLCYEDRLISCYEWRQIKPKEQFLKMHNSATMEWKMCWKCQEKGEHLAREGCPSEI